MKKPPGDLIVVLRGEIGEVEIKRSELVNARQKAMDQAAEYALLIAQYDVALDSLNRVLQQVVPANEDAPRANRPSSNGKQPETPTIRSLVRSFFTKHARFSSEELI